MSAVSDPVVLLGAGGHARVVIDICKAAHINLAGLLVESLQAGDQLDGVPILGTDAWLDTPGVFDRYRFIIAVGDHAIRINLSINLRKRGARFATAIHPSSTLSHSVSVGDGTVIMPQVAINAGTTIGFDCILNTSCSVDHDCVVGDRCHIAPGSCLAGGVKLGHQVFIGAGAIVVPNVEIGDGALIGAGAVVLHSVPPHTTVAGNPARPR